MSRKPFFSVIIPTRQRPARLAACLEALTGLHYPRDRFEVIVVDDGSVIPPEEVIVSFREALDLKLLAQPHAGPATARNNGAAQAKGEFLAFTDDDCEPAPDWLQTMALRFAVTPDCVIGGQTVNALTDNLYSTASQMLIDYLYGYFNPRADQASFFTANNLAVPADQFRSLGGFDASFSLAAAEDRDMCDRWCYYGYPMIYAPEIVVYHSHTLTLRSFWKQHFNYGRGASHYHQLRAQRRQQRLRLEPLLFYTSLLRYPFLRSRDRRALRVAVLLLLSQGANAAGFFWERTKRWRSPVTELAISLDSFAVILAGFTG